MTNPMQRKQLVFTAKALAKQLEQLNKKLTSPYVKPADIEEIKAEIAKIQKRFEELGIKNS